MVMRQALRLVAGGLVVGLAGVLAVDRMVSSMLYEVGGTDPATLGVVALVDGRGGSIVGLRSREAGHSGRSGDGASCPMMPPRIRLLPQVKNPHILDI